MRSLIRAWTVWPVCLSSLHCRIGVFPPASWLMEEASSGVQFCPPLTSPDRFPACQRIDFEIPMSVYQTPNGLWPKYISDLLIPHEAFRPLRPSCARLLCVPGVRGKHEEAEFCFAPRTSNTLPEVCRFAESLISFWIQSDSFIFLKVVPLCTIYSYISFSFFYFNCSHLFLDLLLILLNLM